MRLRWVGVLDRYVLKQWLATFLLSAVGVPTVAVIIDLSERFGRLSDRNIPVGQILLGEAFLFPSKMAILVPAAVLFATVFTLNGMGRHSELTAVQGGGISFYRLILPMLLLAALAVPADYELQELASYSTTRQKELHHEKSSGLRLRPDIVRVRVTQDRLDLGHRVHDQDAGQGDGRHRRRRAIQRRPALDDSCRQRDLERQHACVVAASRGDATCSPTAACWRASASGPCARRSSPTRPPS